MYVSGVPSFGRSRRRSRQTRERAINASGGQEVYLYLVACQYEITCIDWPCWFQFLSLHVILSPFVKRSFRLRNKDP